MEITERQKEIVNYILPRHFATIKEISEAIYTSGATIRRDIKVLEQSGIVKSIYGGVVISEYYKEPVPIYIRDNINSVEKEEVAKTASKLLRDNQTIILDSSSTVRRMCKHIAKRKGMTIITNNLRVCQELKDSHNKVVCTGGTLVQKRECFVGHFAEEFVKSIKADILFFSSQGLSESGDITDSSEEEIALRKIMISSSKQQFFLCDSSKVNLEFSFTLCNTKDITKVILAE